METFLYNVTEKKRERSISIDEVMSYYSNIDIDLIIKENPCFYKAVKTLIIESEKYIEDINCVLIYDDFCKPSCKSISDEYSDEWCQSMNCSSIYSNYCEELKNI